MNIHGETIKGTVIAATPKGARVALDGVNDPCFCRCGLNIGDTAWFSVSGFTQTAEGTMFRLDFDSIISYNAA